ncbi:MAG: hypothetical protein IH585_07375, partial [Anaerolineaceae bacterium]|nr:hypothetical protein [Anaerolineaceae bacterium]
EGHSAPVTACAIAPGGRWVVSASEDTTLKIWDTARGELFRTLEGHTEKITACACHPNGLFIASGSEDGTIRTWNIETGQLLRTIQDQTGTVTACAFSSDGRWFAYSGSGSRLWVRELQRGQILKILEGSTTGCTFSPDGNLIISTAENDTLRVWEIDSNRTMTMKGHTGKVRACACFPDGRFILTASDDWTLKVWELPAPQAMSNYKEKSVRIEKNNFSKDAIIGYSQDGRFVVYADDRNVYKFDTEANQRTLNLGHMIGKADGYLWGDPHKPSCQFSPDGRYIAFYELFRLKLVDGVTGQRLDQLKQLDRLNDVLAYAFSLDGRSLVTAESRLPDSTLSVWDITSGQLIRRIKHNLGSPNACMISPDGSLLVAGNELFLNVWSTNSGAKLHELQVYPEGVRVCAFSLDSCFILSAGEKIIKVWDSASGKLLKKISAHKGWVRACSFSANGHLITSIGDDKTLRVYSLQDEEFQCVLPLDGNLVFLDRQFSGTQIVCGDENGNLYRGSILNIDMNHGSSS